MATTINAPSSAFYSAGVTQLRAATLSTEDYANAYNSLLTIDPTSSPTGQAAFAGTFTQDLAYFTLGATGAPQLVIPPNSPSFSSSPAPIASPASAGVTAAPLVAPAAPTGSPVTVPAGAPCPQGFVASSTATLSQVNQALTLLPLAGLTETTIAGACVPAPTVACIGEWITPDDFLRVTVFTTVTTSGLTLSARILDCRGLVTYLTRSLDGVPLNTATTFIIPLTPGYLLSVSVSDPGSALTSGQVFVSLGLQHASQTGTAPVDTIAQGYVTGLYSVSWPGTATGAPVSAPAAPTGPVSLIQARANGAPSGVSIAVTLPQNVIAGDCLVAFTEYFNVNDPVTMTDTQSNTWTRVIREPSTHYEIWAAGNVNGGATTVTYTMTGPNNFSIQMHVMEFSGIDLNSPADVSASVYNTNPLTATTGASTHSDIGVVSYAGLVTGAAGTGVPAGWKVILDSQTSDTRRIISLWNPNATTAPATWTFTGYQNFSACAVLLAAMHVAGG